MAPAEFSELAAWACSVRLADIPESVMYAARSQTLSVLGSIYSGAHSAPGKACRAAANSLGTSGQSTVLPHGDKVSALAAVLTNAAYSMVHDFDDYMFLGHTGHSAVLASLAVAEECDSTVEELLIAEVIANELAGRLGAFVAIGPQNGQMWSHIHLAASAAAACRLRGLDEEQTAHAMSIAFYMPPFALFPGFFGSDAKVLTAAWPCAIGLYAAALAGEGMRGAPAILNHRQGFAARFSFVPLPELLGGLGDAWVTDSLSCKIYPGCAYIDGPVDAALAATGGRPLDPSRIERIEIAGTALTAGMERLGESAAPAMSLDPIAINFSARRSVALALMHGSLTPPIVEAAEEQADAVRGLAANTRLRESGVLTANMFEGLGRAVRLPDLALQIGLDRFWSARHEIRGAYGSILQRESGDDSARPKKQRKRVRRSTLHRARNGLGLASRAVRALAGARRGFDMSAADFSRLQFRFGAEVSVYMRDGSVLSGSADIPLGAAGRPPAEMRALMLRKFAVEGGGEQLATELENMMEPGGWKASARELTAKLSQGAVASN